MLLLVLTSNYLRDFTNVYILDQFLISTLNTARFLAVIDLLKLPIVIPIHIFTFICCFLSF